MTFSQHMVTIKGGAVETGRRVLLGVYPLFNTSGSFLGPEQSKNHGVM